jgi:hypothetical protein
MTTRTKLNIASITTSAMMFLVIGSHLLRLSDPTQWALLILIWIPLGLVFSYTKKLKDEKAGKVAAGILPASKIEDDKRKAKKRLIVIWICMVLFTLTTFLWMRYVSGISLGLRGDVFISIATLAMVSLIFWIQLTKMTAAKNE